MTEATNVAATSTNPTVSAAALAALAAAGAPGAGANGAATTGAPAEAEKPKRQVSPQATAALALHRARAELGTAILEVLEKGENGDLAKLKPLAEAHIKAENARKAAEEAERKANAPERGLALAEYREKTNAALALQEYLASTGANIDELLAKAKEAKAEATAKAAEEAKAKADALAASVAPSNPAA
jgi:hypothetical protein